MIITSLVDSKGIPSGGDSGQVLAKNSATNYDVGWITSSGLPSVTTADNGKMLYVKDGAWILAKATSSLITVKLSVGSRGSGSSSYDLSDYAYTSLHIQGTLTEHTESITLNEYVQIGGSTNSVHYRYYYCSHNWYDNYASLAVSASAITLNASGSGYSSPWLSASCNVNVEFQL